MISCKFLDKTINRGNLGTTLKNYYERNSRGFVLFDITYRVISVPFKHSQQNGPTKAFEFIKKLLPDSFDIYVVLCNPKTSGYARKFVKTWASTTNVIHEVGHALGLSHANQTINGKVQTSRDSFSQMTINAPYASLNSVHRLQLGWFLENELIDYVGSEPATFKLAMLKDLDDRINVKVIRFRPNEIRPFLISYGTVRNENYIAIHTYTQQKRTGFFKWSSFLIARYRAVEGKVYENSEAGLALEVLKSTDKFLEVLVYFSNGLL